RKYLSYRTILPGCSPNQALISKGLRLKLTHSDSWEIICPNQALISKGLRHSVGRPGCGTWFRPNQALISKGLRLRWSQVRSGTRRSEPSPDFKGIKTRCHCFVWCLSMRPNQALISKGLRLDVDFPPLGTLFVRTKP
ncbi:hypothetical protein, partial [Tepidimonas sp.]|uniref:hypothetical protein n=1 Tax=Tepidimonas sp. TaxID=2002775 RepID=UPI003918AB76